MPQMPIPGQHIDILHPVHPHNTAVWFVLLFVYCIVQYNTMPYKRDVCNTMALWHCSADPGGPHTKLHGPPQLGSSTCDSIDLHHFSRERGASRRIEACPLAGGGPTDQPTNPSTHQKALERLRCSSSQKQQTTTRSWKLATEGVLLFFAIVSIARHFLKPTVISFDSRFFAARRSIREPSNTGTSARPPALHALHRDLRKWRNRSRRLLRRQSGCPV